MVTKRMGLVCVTVLAMCAGLQRAHAGPILLQPVDIAEGTNNDGGMFGTGETSDTLSRVFPMTVAQGPPEQRVAAEFDIGGILSVDSAILQVFGEVISPTGLAIYDYAGDGVISLYDMNNTSWLAAFASLTPSGPQIFEFDITAALQRRLDAGDLFLGLNLLDEVDDTLVLSDPGMGIIVSGILKGDVIPEPSTLTLWSLGAVALVGLGWRRRKRAA